MASATLAGRGLAAQANRPTFRVRRVIPTVIRRHAIAIGSPQGGRTPARRTPTPPHQPVEGLGDRHLAEDAATWAHWGMRCRPFWPAGNRRHTRRPVLLQIVGGERGCLTGSADPADRCAPETLDLPAATLDHELGWPGGAVDDPTRCATFARARFAADIR